MEIFVRDLRECHTNFRSLSLTQSSRWSSFKRGQCLDGRPKFILESREQNRLCNQYFKEIAIPKRILSDHGTQCTSNLRKQRLSELGTGVIYSSTRHPQPNPVERVMRELGRAFGAVCSENHTSWAFHVPKIELVLNS